MTKKFWNDWQKRLGETKRIHLFYPDHVYSSKRYTWHLSADKFISFKFEGDKVEIVYEEKHPVFNSHTGSHWHIQSHKTTLYRKDITSIEFIK